MTSSAPERKPRHESAELGAGQRPVLEQRLGDTADVRPAPVDDVLRDLGPQIGLIVGEPVRAAGFVNQGEIVVPAVQVGAEANVLRGHALMQPFGLAGHLENMTGLGERPGVGDDRHRRHIDAARPDRGEAHAPDATGPQRHVAQRPAPQQIDDHMPSLMPRGHTILAQIGRFRLGRGHAAHSAYPASTPGSGMSCTSLRWWWRAEEGRVTAFVLALLLGLLALTGLCLDGGLALASKVRAGGQAESAARAGAQALDLAAYRANGVVRIDPVRARDLAQRYLASVGATGTVTATEDTVTVEITAVYRTQLLSLAGIDDIHTHGRGTAHPQRGVTGIEP